MFFVIAFAFFAMRVIFIILSVFLIAMEDGFSLINILSFHDFLCWDVKVRNRVNVLTATARSIDDIICFRTSFIYISKRVLCLINLI